MAKIEEILAEKSEAPKPDPIETNVDTSVQEPEGQQQVTEPTIGPGAESGDEPPKRSWGYAAYKDEKEKRQQERDARLKAEAERDQERQDRGNDRKRLEELERALAQSRIQSQLQPTPPPNQFEDPDGYTNHLRAEYRGELQKVAFNSSMNVARKFYKQEFDEAYKEAERVIALNPHDPLALTLQRSDDPGEELVNWHRRNKTLSELSDPVAYEQKVLEKALADPERRKTILAQIAGQAQQPPGQQTLAPSTLPSNLAGARSVGERNPAWTGPKPLSEILSKRK